MKQLKHSEEQRRVWRDKFRLRTGARPLAAIRAEQAAKREVRAAEREARRLARKPARTPDEKRAAQKAWVAANRDRYRELLRSWRIRNRKKRKARQKASGKRLRAYLRGLQKNRCAICGIRLDAAVHVDHIVPLSRGGSNARSNLQLTHPVCNIKKSAKDPIEYARELGRLL